ncbi:MAG: DnaJ domain-containing protein [Pseudomonadota bacterium]|nr:DnaJ domain-containing protein [Pseudomonadota bacterium]
MTKTEALDVLGLSGTPPEDEIRSAHKRLMKKVHPDQEGSAWMAKKLNQARDVLLDK